MSIADRALKAARTLMGEEGTLHLLVRCYDGNKPEHRWQIITSVLVEGCSEGDQFFEPAATLEEALQNVVDGKVSDIVGWTNDES